MVRYAVFSLDMWGHVPADCLDHTCVRCVTQDPDTGECTHDDDRCDCSEECNQQFRCGAIEVAEDTDNAVLQALHDEGFLSELGLNVAELDDYSNGPLDVNDKEGRRLFHLIPEEKS